MKLSSQLKFKSDEHDDETYELESPRNANLTMRSEEYKNQKYAEEEKK